MDSEGWLVAMAIEMKNLKLYLSSTKIIQIMALGQNLPYLEDTSFSIDLHRGNISSSRKA